MSNTREKVAEKPSKIIFAVIVIAAILIATKETHYPDLEHFQKAQVTADDIQCARSCIMWMQDC